MQGALQGFLAFGFHLLAVSRCGILQYEITYRKPEELESIQTVIVTGREELPASS
jgi:hypothetical protein